MGRNCRLDVEPDYLLRHQLLLTPDLLALEWDSVGVRLTPFMRDIMGHTLAPWPVFSSILQRTFNDVVVLTAAVTLAWYMNEQQATDLGGKTAELLLRRQVIEGEGSRRQVNFGRPESTFETIFSVIIRQGLTERLSKGRYGTGLDDIVRFLGQMSVRRVVPGRIYSSWGLGGLDTIALQLLAMLLANVPDESDNGVVDALGVLAGNEELFADGDASLRRILFDINSVAKPLGEQVNFPALERGLRALAPTKDFAAAVARLQAILTASADIIDKRRTEPLRSRALDPVKFAAMGEALESALGAVSGQLHMFKDFRINARDRTGLLRASFRLRG